MTAPALRVYTVFGLEPPASVYQSKLYNNAILFFFVGGVQKEKPVVQGLPEVPHLASGS